MDKLANRKRCLECKYYSHNECPLMVGADTFQIEKCILEFDAIKAIEEDTLDHFVFFSNPRLYLAYLGFKDKENYPKVGQKVLTLTGGFHTSYSGKFITVIGEDDIQLFLTDGIYEFCVVKDGWWKQLFIIE